MVAAREDGRTVGGALALRRDEANATLRIIGFRPVYRHRGLGRRLVERAEHEARRLGGERIALGTEEAVGFWHHLGCVLHLLFQWVFEPSRHQVESAAVLAGPLVGRRHWRSSFNDVPQLFVELDEPRLDLRDKLGRELNGCHVGFVMIKSLRTPFQRHDGSEQAWPP